MDLARIGLFYRIFGRVKSEISIAEKFKRKGGRDSYRLSDFFGIRVAVYFADDEEIVRRVVRERFREIEVTKDEPEAEVFKPRRHNLVFEIPLPLAEEFAALGYGEKIMSTFEVQLRSILSEGWHEVEHDLRYKSKRDWVGCGAESRALNGLLATLETCDWGMLQMFDRLARKHYRDGRWDAMVRCRFRLRFRSAFLSEPVEEIILASRHLQRSLFRFDRALLLRVLMGLRRVPPLTLDAILFVCNRAKILDVDLFAAEPEVLVDVLDEVESLRESITSGDVNS